MREKNYKSDYFEQISCHDSNIPSNQILLRVFFIYLYLVS